MNDDFPIKNKYRARRRQLTNKVKQKVKRLVKIFDWNEESTMKVAEHLQFCTCECCKNPRDGNSKTDKTRQELKAELSEKEDSLDV